MSKEELKEITEALKDLTFGTDLRPGTTERIAMELMGINKGLDRLGDLIADLASMIENGYLESKDGGN